jgi:hypothetical protein
LKEGNRCSKRYAVDNPTIPPPITAIFILFPSLPSTNFDSTQTDLGIDKVPISGLEAGSLENSPCRHLTPDIVIKMSIIQIDRSGGMHDFGVMPTSEGESSFAHVCSQLMHFIDSLNYFAN